MISRFVHQSIILACATLLFALPASAKQTAETPTSMIRALYDEIFRFTSDPNHNLKSPAPRFSKAFRNAAEEYETICKKYVDYLDEGEINDQDVLAQCNWEPWGNVYLGLRGDHPWGTWNAENSHIKVKEIKPSLVEVILYSPFLENRKNLQVVYKNVKENGHSVLREVSREFVKPVISEDDATRIRYKLVLENGFWVVDDIISDKSRYYADSLIKWKSLREDWKDTEKYLFKNYIKKSLSINK